MTLFSEVPESLIVTHDTLLHAGQNFFTISADDSSIIALAVDGEIIGVAEGTGNPLDVSIAPQSGGDTLTITVTKANYYRYESDVPVVEVGVSEDDYIQSTGVITCDVQPNPFSKLTTVSFSIGQSAKSSVLEGRESSSCSRDMALQIYDAAGRLVRSFLLPNSYLLNSTSVVWDGTDDSNRQLPGGVYFVKLRTDGIDILKKVVLLR